MKTKLWQSKTPLLLGLILLIIFAALILSSGKKSADKQIDNAYPSPSQGNPKKDNTFSGETIEQGEMLEYKNEELGFAFSYPKKYGAVRVATTTGGETKEGRLFVFNFTNLCDTCKPGETNPAAIIMYSPGLIEMGAANPKYGGFGSSRPFADSAGYIENPDGTYTFKRGGNSSGNEVQKFQGENIEGIIIQREDTFHNLYQTSVTFNLDHPEITGFEFMTHDKIGESTNANNLISVAKTFRLIK